MFGVMPKVTVIQHTTQEAERVPQIGPVHQPAYNTGGRKVTHDYYNAQWLLTRPYTWHDIRATLHDFSATFRATFRATL